MATKRNFLWLLLLVASLSLAATQALADPECPPGWIEILSPEDGSSYRNDADIPVWIRGEARELGCVGPREHLVKWRVYNTAGQIVFEDFTFVDAGMCCEMTPFEIRDAIPRLPSGRYRMTVAISPFHAAPYADDEVEFRVVVVRSIGHVQP